MPTSIYHPGFGETLRYRVDRVSDDPDTQVAQVIGVMADYVRADSHSPEIQADVRSIRLTGASGGQDPIQDTFDWVKSRMQFVRDEDTAAPIEQSWSGTPQAVEITGEPVVEVLIRPRDMAVAKRAQGDCDDYVQYGFCLLRAQGIPVNFCTVAADLRQPDVYSHVYGACYPGGVRVPVDFSHGPYPGWEYVDPARPQRKWKEWAVDYTPMGRSRLLPLLVAGGIGVAIWSAVVKRRTNR